VLRQMPRATEIGAPRQLGFALIVVLWFLVLLAFIAVHIVAAGRTEIYIARNTVANARAEALAEAGVFQAIYSLSETTPERRWDADGEPHQLLLSEGEIAITATDEKAKIDPNVAPQSMVEALFLALGLEGDVARSVAAGIARAAHPPGSAPQPVGGTVQQALAPPATPGQAAQGPAFETLDDLLQVAAMTPDVLAQARPHLTVDSGLPKPVLVHDDAIVRRALEIAGGDKSAPQNGATAPSAEQGADGQLVDIVSTARTKDGAVFVREAVVRIDATSAPGFTVLRWQRREAPDS
jgi:general secretion pathway protein K